MSTDFIPVCEPLLAGNERKYVLDAIDSGWISSSGKYIKAFEESFAHYIGARHGIAVCNGTVALHTALMALGIGKGDEVIVPDFTMIASAFSVCYTGAMPVFVDAESETWNIDTAKIEEKITPRTKAIMVVHIYGHPTDMKPIYKLKEKYGIKIIEDAAEVHGAEYDGKRCGNLGDIATFSFFANKIATTGEGGMVVTNDDDLATRCRYFKNLCFPVDGPRNYMHNDIGFNYRMSNLHAAIGLAQVERLDDYVRMRRNVHLMYKEYLKDLPGIRLQPEKPNVKNVYWMNGIVIDEQVVMMSRDQFSARLKDFGIDTRLFFVGMHRQKSLIDYGCDASGSYAVTDWLANNGLYLPSGSGITENQVHRISVAIKEIIGA